MSAPPAVARDTTGLPIVPGAVPELPAFCAGLSAGNLLLRDCRINFVHSAGVLPPSSFLLPVVSALTLHNLPLRTVLLHDNRHLGHCRRIE
jgi:hypothetical protein